MKVSKNRSVDVILDEGSSSVGNLNATTPGSAGIDLRAHIPALIMIQPQAAATLVPTGIRIDMSKHADMCAVIIPRSGMGHKLGLVMGNGIGLIDSDYQGEIFISVWNRNPAEYHRGMGTVKNAAIAIEPGDRIAQLVFLPTLTRDIVFNVVDSFDEASERAEGGFGSTGVAA